MLLLTVPAYGRENWSQQSPTPTYYETFQKPENPMLQEQHEYYITISKLPT